MSELDYDPETGLFTWKATNRRGFIGRQAGCFSKKDGYVKIRLNGTLYLAHRLAWNMTYPEDPVGPDEQIDHINHNRADDRIENLRKTTNKGNSRNRSLRASSKSGVTGVYWRQDVSKWRATIKVDGLEIHLGFFANLDDAIKARATAEVEYGFHENHGK